MPPSPVQIFNYVSQGLARLTSQYTKSRPFQVVVTTGTGFVHVTSGAQDGAASLGTAAQIPVVNAGGTDLAWVSLSGDLTISATGVVTLTTKGMVAVHQVTGSGTTTVAETAGRVLMVLASLSAATVIKAPAAPATGMSIVIKVKDTTFSGTNTVQFNGNGNHVEYEGANDAGGANLSKAFAPADLGTGPSMEWVFDGVLWASI